MPGSPVDEGQPSPEKNIGSARTSRKSKRRKAIRFLDWSGQQEFVNSHRTGVQPQSQAVEDGDGASPGPAGQTVTPKVSALSLDSPSMPGLQTQHQPQAIEDGGGASPGPAGDEDGASPEPAGETIVPKVSAPTPDFPPLPGPQTQHQSQAVEDRDRASPQPAGETVAPKASASTPDLPPLPDPQMQETSSWSVATNPIPDPQKRNKSLDYYAINRFLLDDHTPEPPPPAIHSPPMSEQTDGIHNFQLAQEEQKADDWPPENLRPNAQNLRYGGYPTQPAPQNRNTPLGSGRLQNTTKLGAFGNFVSLVV